MMNFFAAWSRSAYSGWASSCQIGLCAINGSQEQLLGRAHRPITRIRYQNLEKLDY